MDCTRNYLELNYSRSGPIGDRHTVVRKDLTCSPCSSVDRRKVLNCKKRICLDRIGVGEVLGEVLSKLKG